MTRAGDEADEGAPRKKDRTSICEGSSVESDNVSGATAISHSA